MFLGPQKNRRVASRARGASYGICPEGVVLVSRDVLGVRALHGP